MRKLVIAAAVSMLFTAYVEAGDAVPESAPLLSIQDVDSLPWGTPIYGFSTLDPSGPTRFEGRLLAVMWNAIGPGHSLIATELDSKFPSSNIIAGQSGSPVFVDIKGVPHKIGAVSRGEEMATNPIAYLTPIKEMMDTQAKGSVTDATGLQRVSLASWLGKLLPSRDPVLQMLDSGATSNVSVTGTVTPVTSGSVLGVQLAWGDFDLTAYGTVSNVDKENVLLFGHPMLQLGPSQYRLVPAKVLAVQRAFDRSHIVAAPIAGAKPVGMITQDREAAIAGVLGKEPSDVIPVSLTLTTSDGQKHEFSFTSIADPTLAPRIIGIGVARTIKAWSRDMGDMTLFVDGAMEVEGAGNIEFSDSYTSAEGPLFLLNEKASSVLQNKFTKARIKNVKVSAKVFDEYRKLGIDTAAIDPGNFKPGDTVNLKVTLSQQLKEAKTLALQIALPTDLQFGTGKIVVGDADSVNKIEAGNSSVVNLTTLVDSLNQKRRSDAIYVYVVLPPSRVSPGEGGKETALQLGDISAVMKETSKRLSSNVLEYQVLVSDFQVTGSKEIEFKVGSKAGDKPAGHP